MHTTFQLQSIQYGVILIEISYALKNYQLYVLLGNEGQTDKPFMPRRLSETMSGAGKYPRLILKRLRVPESYMLGRGLGPWMVASWG